MANLRALLECAPYVARGEVALSDLTRSFGLTASEVRIFQGMIDGVFKRADAFKTDIDPPSLVDEPPAPWPTLKD